MEMPRRLEALEQRRSRLRDSLDGFAWHTRHTTRISLCERKKGNCQLGFHLLCVWRGGRGRGRKGTNDTRVCAERDERCIRVYIGDDRI